MRFPANAEAAATLTTGPDGADEDMAKWIAIGLGAILVAAGATSIWQGYDIVQIERGWTEVISGATAMTGGVVTISIGLLIGRIDRLAKLLAGRPAISPPEIAEAIAPAMPDPILDFSPDFDEPQPTVDPIPAPKEDVAPVVAEQNVPPAPSVAEPFAETPSLVGRYSFGGANYALFSDGTIEAETPAGITHFASLTELRAHIEKKNSAPVT